MAASEKTEPSGEAWREAPPDFTLPLCSVHVWRAWLDLRDDEVKPLASLLAPEESARAARFAFERDRRRFVAGRAILRSLLARYLNTPARQFTFDYGRRGKPQLADPALASWCFNLSHSQGLALYALALDHNVGIDVEALRTVPDADDIATQFFSPREAAEYLALPPAQREQAFFHCWTQKEALIKAVGEGFALPLSSFDVCVHPDRPAGLLRHDGVLGTSGNWVLYDVPPSRDTPAPSRATALTRSPSLPGTARQGSNSLARAARRSRSNANQRTSCCPSCLPMYLDCSHRV